MLFEIESRFNNGTPFKNQHPEEWKAISENIDGTMKTSSGRFHFTTVDPPSKI